MFIAVGTPPDEDGSADLKYVLSVARTIGEHLHKPAVVVDKSTVPVGTAEKVRAALREGMALCESVGDYVSRDILLVQLRDTEEDHAYWLEKQIGLIDKVGLQNYLQSQTGTVG